MEKETVETVYMKVQGMTCQHCEDKVLKALNSVPGVSKVAIYLDEGACAVQGDALIVEDLLAAIAGAGYSASI